MPAEAAKERQIITDKLVIEKTGKTMEEWFVVLDKKGAMKLKANEIYLLIQSIGGLKPLGEWNQGLLSTSYQWSRGLRERGEKADGFEVSVSKTIAVPIDELYRSFVDDAIRSTWVKGHDINITKSTESRSVRAVWADSNTRLSVDFYAKGDAKAQIVVQHLKMPDAAMADEMKEYWATALAVLKSILEAATKKRQRK